MGLYLQGLEYSALIAGEAAQSTPRSCPQQAEQLPPALCTAMCDPKAKQNHNCSVSPHKQVLHCFPLCSISVFSHPT